VFTLDPCQIVTSAEASKLASASYGAGKEDTTQGGGKICWYGAQTLNVLEVLVAVASDPATAQAQWSQEEAQVQSQLQQALQYAPGVTVSFNLSDTSLSGADRAAVGTFSETFSGHPISGSGIYVLKGATFFAIVDLVVGQAAPSSTAMEGQAQTVLGRLPRSPSSRTPWSEQGGRPPRGARPRLLGEAPVFAGDGTASMTMSSGDMRCDGRWMRTAGWSPTWPGARHQLAQHHQWLI